MNNLFSTSRKGQSAIEYLMTYGWMLLVVAIVGGAVITTVQSNQNQCQGEIPTSLEAAQQGFGVSQFGVGSGGNAQLVLENSGQEEITINSVSIAGNSASGGDSTVGVGGSTTYTASGFGTDDSCTSVQIEVDYNQGSLSNQVLNGTIEAQVSVP